MARTGFGRGDFLSDGVSTARSSPREDDGVDPWVDALLGGDLAEGFVGERDFGVGPRGGRQGFDGGAYGVGREGGIYSLEVVLIGDIHVNGRLVDLYDPFVVPVYSIFNIASPGKLDSSTRAIATRRMVLDLWMHVVFSILKHCSVKQQSIWYFAKLSVRDDKRFGQANHLLKILQQHWQM